MVPTPSPRIPQELCEKVIACVTVSEYDPDRYMEDQDRPYLTLRQCALVCSAWLPSARSRIFRVVDLSSLSAERLLKLLNLNPTLSRYMTAVVIRAPREVAAACLGLVAELAPRLTAVQHLTVRGGMTTRPDDWDWQFYGDGKEIREIQSAILPILQGQRVVSITLKDILIANKEEFYQFICVPPLVTVILDNVYLSPKGDWLAGNTGDTLVQTLERNSLISELAVYSQDATLMRLLLHRSFPLSVPALRGLSISLDDVGDMCDFLPLLSAIGSSLNSFGVRLPSRCELKKHRRFSGILDAIPTLPNTYIEHLYISGFDRRDPSFGSYTKHFDGAEFVTSLLSRLPAPQRLRTVNINEDVEIIWRRDEEFPNLQWHNWRALDELLKRDSFSNVKTLNFFAGLNEFDLRCEDVRSCVAPQFRSFRGRKGTVFNLTVGYSNLAWSRARDREEDSRLDNINAGDVCVDV